MSKVYDTSMGSYKNRKGELIHLSTKKLMQLLQEVPELTAIQDILNELSFYQYLESQKNRSQLF